MNRLVCNIGKTMKAKDDKGGRKKRNIDTLVSM